MRNPSKDTAATRIPVSRFRSIITKAVPSVALLCAAIGLSIGFPVPASAAPPGWPVNCPGITWLGTDNQNSLVFAEISEDNYIWCYIGHDEPAVQFYSTLPGSGSNMTWELILPTEGTTPTFQNYLHFQLDLALCDPNSTNANRVGACTPNSDANNDVTTAAPSGAALLELKFIPPGEPAQSIVGLSCSNQTTTKWCAVMQVQVETQCPAGGANNNVFNEAWITTNGQPPGPVYAGGSPFTPATAGANTFTMNPGDRIRVVLTDTVTGLLVVIVDETTHTTGFARASQALGFQSLTPPAPAAAPNCTTVPWTFRPLWNTATTTHILPWALANVNVQFALETGHFEIQDPPPPPPVVTGDADDKQCSGTNCFATDSDFDGPPYTSGAWPPAGGGKSVQITSISGTGIGPSSSNLLYPQLQFETSFRNTLGSNGSMLGLIGTTVGANTNFFYPYFSQLKPGITPTITCSLVIGNYATSGGGVTVANNFGKQAQYDNGGPYTSGENAGNIIANPCPR